MPSHRRLAVVIFITIALCSLASAQDKSSGTRGPQLNKSRPVSDRELTQVQTARSFVERASSFRDLQAKVITLVNLGSLLWAHKGQEDYARAIFMRLYDELKLAGQSESQLKTVSTGSTDPNMVPRLRRILLSFLAKHDTPLAQRLLAEVTVMDPRADRWSLSVATDLIRDGDAAAALTILDPTLRSDLSALDKFDLGMLVYFLLNLNKQDAAAADTLFLQSLKRLAAHPRVTADELLVIGNYLFIDDHDFSPDFMLFTATKVENIYFPESIVGERSGITKELAHTYLATALNILGRQLEVESVALMRKRYAVAARLLGTKAAKFAPELVDPFAAMSQSVASSELMVISVSEKSGANKLIDYNAASAELEKIVGIDERDARALGLAGTAYLQKDLDTASKLAKFLSDAGVRTRVNNVIAFRRAADYLERGDAETAEELTAKVDQPELHMVLDLGLASLDIKKKKPASALGRLQAILTAIRERQPEARALYDVSAAALLIKIEPTLALQTLGEAIRAFDESSKSLNELRSRAHLSRIRIGKKEVSFSISTTAVSFGDLNDAFVALYRKSPQITASLLLGVKDEKVLGTALIALAKASLETTPIFTADAKGR